VGSSRGTARPENPPGFSSGPFSWKGRRPAWWQSPPRSFFRESPALAHSTFFRRVTSKELAVSTRIWSTSRTRARMASTDRLEEACRPPHIRPARRGPPSKSPSWSPVPAVPFSLRDYGELLPVHRPSFGNGGGRHGTPFPTVKSAARRFFGQPRRGRAPLESRRPPRWRRRSLSSSPPSPCPAVIRLQLLSVNPASSPGRPEMDGASLSFLLSTLLNRPSRPTPKLARRPREKIGILAVGPPGRQRAAIGPSPLRDQQHRQSRWSRVPRSPALIFMLTARPDDVPREST